MIDRIIIPSIHHGVPDDQGVLGWLRGVGEAGGITQMLGKPEENLSTDVAGCKT